MEAAEKTPRKPSRDICRVCGKQFHQNKKNRLNVFSPRAEGSYASMLEAITHEPVQEMDGLARYICTTCGGRLRKWAANRNNEKTDLETTILRDIAYTSSFSRKKRELPVSPPTMSSVQSHVKIAPKALKASSNKYCRNIIFSQISHFFTLAPS